MRANKAKRTAGSPEAKMRKARFTALTGFLWMFGAGFYGVAIAQQTDTGDACDRQFASMLADSESFPTDESKARYLETLSTSCSGSAIYETRLAYYYSRIGRNGEARTLIEEAMSDPRGYERQILMGLADVEYWDQNLSEAEEVARALVDRYPGWPGGYGKLGQILVTLGRFEESIGYLETANSLNEDSQSLLLLTMAYYKTGNYLESARAMQSALSQDKSVLLHTDAVCSATLALVRLGYVVEAKDLLDKHVALMPDSSSLPNVQKTAEIVGRAISQSQ